MTGKHLKVTWKQSAASEKMRMGCLALTKPAGCHAHGQKLHTKSATGQVPTTIPDETGDHYISLRNWTDPLSRAAAKPAMDVFDQPIRKGPVLWNSTQVWIRPAIGG